MTRIGVVGLLLVALACGARATATMQVAVAANGDIVAVTPGAAVIDLYRYQGFRHETMKVRCCTTGAVAATGNTAVVITHGEHGVVALDIDVPRSFLLDERVLDGAGGAALCPGDFNADGAVTVDEIITTVDAALGGCGR